MSRLAQVRRARVQPAAAAVLLTMLTITSPAPEVTAGDSGAREVTLQARKFEWDPGRIEIRVGETVELSLASLDVKHGFKCKGLGIKPVKFRKGRPVTVTISPQRTGTYRFACAHFCGLGHRRMKGEIVVVP